MNSQLFSVVEYGHRMSILMATIVTGGKIQMVLFL